MSSSELSKADKANKDMEDFLQQAVDSMAEGNQAGALRLVMHCLHLLFEARKKTTADFAGVEMRTAEFMRNFQGMPAAETGRWKAEEIPVEKSKHPLRCKVCNGTGLRSGTKFTGDNHCRHCSSSGWEPFVVGAKPVSDYPALDKAIADSDKAMAECEARKKKAESEALKKKAEEIPLVEGQEYLCWFECGKCHAVATWRPDEEGNDWSGPNGCFTKDELRPLRMLNSETMAAAKASEFPWVQESIDPGDISRGPAAWHYYPYEGGLSLCGMIPITGPPRVGKMPHVEVPGTAICHHCLLKSPNGKAVGEAWTKAGQDYYKIEADPLKQITDRVKWIIQLARKKFPEADFISVTLDGDYYWGAEDEQAKKADRQYFHRPFCICVCPSRRIANYWGRWRECTMEAMLKRLEGEPISVKETLEQKLGDKYQ